LQGVIQVRSGKGRLLVVLQVGSRSRIGIACALALLVASLVAGSMVSPHPATAQDAVAALPTHTLLLTERFTAAGPVGGQSGDLPRDLVALRGEREGFQVAVHNTTGGALRLAARIEPDAALQAAAGTIDAEVLRVGFVRVPQGSTRLGTQAGEYADPLPPLREDSGDVGLLHVGAGQWGGVAVIVRVRTSAAAGTYAGAVSFMAGETVVARQPFSIEVRPGTLTQNGDRDYFATVSGNVEAEAYWLQHRDMRDRPRGTDLWPDRTRQVAGLIDFLDQRGITPTEFPFGNPSQTGSYSCYLDQKGLPRQTFLAQFRGRYLSGVNDADPARGKFRTRFAPAATAGCDLDKRSAHFEGTLPAGTSAKQDDVFNPAAPAYWNNVNAAWTSNKLWTPRTYVKHPFDEPSASTAAFRRTMDVEVPKATVAMRRAFGNRAKIVIADWPRDSAKRRVCRTFGTGQRCTTLSGDEHSNRKQWDGLGLDDPHVWMVPFSRLYGRTTPPTVMRDYKVTRVREYATRLDRIKKLRGTREVWAYNFYTADTRMPQLTIDAPGTDARLQYWMLAREGHTGLYVSNLLAGWGQSVQLHTGTTLRRKGNPYDEALYFRHPVYGMAAGWGTFIYPGYSPELGLVGETARNSEQAWPVTSLRLEGMRDGNEDANLHRMYRAKFGEQRYQALVKRIFPGGYRPLTGNTLGNVVMISYGNANLATRMDQVRRQMIIELTA
jgi:hypothetical protein